MDSQKVVPSKLLKRIESFDLDLLAKTVVFGSYEIMGPSMEKENKNDSTYPQFWSIKCVALERNRRVLTGIAPKR